METGIKQKVLDEIKALARKYHIQRVILFGSRARGDFHRTSDIDLAVLGGDVNRFALDVEEETDTLLMFDIVDLGRSVQEELREAIEKEGKVLYEGYFFLFRTL
ncbi:MAG: nucleotidyltransferase domain-containing protein [Eubacteriales bacterium]|nr:nucleotidyltransferase domain-containing protein [Eubacteriales bacterium]